MQWSVVVKRLFRGDVLCRGRAFSRGVDGEVLQLLRAGDVCKAAFCAFCVHLPCFFCLKEGAIATNRVGCVHSVEGRFVPTRGVGLGCRWVRCCGRNVFSGAR